MVLNDLCVNDTNELLNTCKYGILQRNDGAHENVFLKVTQLNCVI